MNNNNNNNNNIDRGEVHEGSIHDLGHAPNLPEDRNGAGVSRAAGSVLSLPGERGGVAVGVDRRRRNSHRQGGWTSAGNVMTSPIRAIQRLSSQTTSLSSVTNSNRPRLWSAGSSNSMSNNNNNNNNRHLMRLSLQPQQPQPTPSPPSPPPLPLLSSSSWALPEGSPSPPIITTATAASMRQNNQKRSVTFAASSSSIPCFVTSSLSSWSPLTPASATVPAEATGRVSGRHHLDPHRASSSRSILSLGNDSHEPPDSDQLEEQVKRSRSSCSSSSSSSSSSTSLGILDDKSLAPPAPPLSSSVMKQGEPEPNVDGSLADSVGHDHHQKEQRGLDDDDDSMVDYGYGAEQNETNDRRPHLAVGGGSSFSSSFPTGNHVTKESSSSSSSFTTDYSSPTNNRFKRDGDDDDDSSVVDNDDSEHCGGAGGGGSPSHASVTEQDLEDTKDTACCCCCCYYCCSNGMSCDDWFGRWGCFTLPKLDQIAIAVVQYAPCFVCCRVRTPTHRAILGRLNILLAVWALFPIGMAVFLANVLYNPHTKNFSRSLPIQYWPSTDTAPDQTSGMGIGSANLWNINGPLLLLGWIAAIVLVATIFTWRVVRDVNLMGAIRYLVRIQTQLPL